MEPQTVIVGVEVDHVVDLSKEIDVISDEAFDFIVAPLAHPLNERQLVHGDASFVSQILPFTRSDLIMPGQDWRAMVIGRVSTWIRPDSANSKIRDNSIKVCYSYPLFLYSALPLPTASLSNTPRGSIFPNSQLSFAVVPF